MGIVRVHNGAPRWRAAAAGEQAPLGGEVLVEVAVVIEVVAREVGEDGDLKLQTTYALLRQRVRRDFHHRFAHAHPHALGE